MKIGITLKDYFKDYLEEVAKVNGMSVTRICGIIVENYLSYNKNKKVIPYFYPSYSVSLLKSGEPDIIKMVEDDQIHPEDSIDLEEAHRIAKTPWFDSED